MKRKVLKSILAGAILSVSLFSTVALASSATFAGQKLYGYIHTSFQTVGYDYGWAESSYPGLSGYVTTTYIEAQDPNGYLFGTDFKYGATYSRTNTIQYIGVFRFNSSHGMASNNDVYTALVTCTNTSW